MRRREFITLIGSASVAWSLAARAQAPKRRIGMLMSLFENDPEGEPRVRAFVDGLQQLGWTDGHNIRIEIRWAGNPADTGKYAAELVALAPDAIFASASVNVAALQRITRSVGDMLGSGLVTSLARPDGNTTGVSILAGRACQSCSRQWPDRSSKSSVLPRSPTSQSNRQPSSNW